MSAENEIEVKLGVNDSDVASKFGAAAESVKLGVEKMKSSMESLKGHVESMQKAFIAVTAILAGGALFKEAVKETTAMAGEVTSLSKKLGISREEASYLDVALKHIGATSEDYIDITTKLNKGLRNNEASFQAMGVVTRDANGNYANQQQVLESALGVMNSYKEGTDRNLASMKLFGRGADDATKFLKLNAEMMAESKEIAQAYGLVMGQDVADNAKKMKMAMATVSTAGEAIQIAIGKAVMPELTKMSTFLKENAVPIMESVSAIIGVVVDVMSGMSEIISDLWGACQEAFTGIGSLGAEIFGGSLPKNLNIFVVIMNVIRSGISLLVGAVKMGFANMMLPINEVINIVMTLAKVWRALQNLDMTAANAAMKEGAAKAEQIARDHWAKLKQIYSDGKDKLADVWVGKKNEKPGGEVPDKHSGGNKSFKDDKETGPKEKDLTAAKLALQKAEFEAELAELKDNNARAAALYDDAYANNLITTKEYYDAKLALSNADVDKEIEAKKREISAAKEALATAQQKDSPDGEKQVLKFRTDLVKLTSTLTILEAQRAEAGINNNTRMIEAERARANKITSINIDANERSAMASIEEQKMLADAKYAAGAISNSQLIELEAKFEDQKTAIAAKAIAARRDMEIGGQNDPAAVEALNQQLLAEAERHALAMKMISLKSATETNRPFKAIQDSMAQSLQSTIQGLMSRTVTLAGAMKQILSSLGMTIIAELITKPLAAKAIAFIQEKLFNVGAVTSQAGVAGAAATASAAAIPLYGWAIAPEAGMAASAAAMAYAPLAAEKGFDVPAGVNPMTQLHQKEMVLPAKYADVIRGLAASNGGSEGGSQAPQIHYNDHSGKLTEAEIRRNAKVIGEALRDLQRKQK